MTPDKTLNTLAILMPGDMGHGCASQFRQHGLRVVTCLAGRSQRTKSLAETAGLENLPSLGDLVQSADLILSILPPEHALSQAHAVATAMKSAGAYPDYVDCNAISPTTTKQVAAAFDGLPAHSSSNGCIRASYPCRTRLSTL